jgi:hypothetical protein
MTSEPAVKIWTVDNGYVMHSPVIESTVVCEDDETDKGACVSTARLLYAVLDALGAAGSKHDAFRVRVSVIERDSGEDVL